MTDHARIVAYYRRRVAEQIGLLRQRLAPNSHSDEDLRFMMLESEDLADVIRTYLHVTDSGPKRPHPADAPRPGAMDREDGRPDLAGGA